MNKGIHILFVDDRWCRPGNLFIQEEYGTLQEGKIPYVFHCETAENGGGGYSAEPVLRKLREIRDVKVVVLDIMFGRNSDRLGLNILKHIRREYPILPVIIMTALDEDNEVVVESMEYGANEYLVKKPTLKEMETVLRAYTQTAPSNGDEAIWGNSPAIREVRALIARVALGACASVVISGESGTGKELVARAIHRQGSRRSKPFIDKNCAYENSNVLESDLCGHEKGAFTDAIRMHLGRIERANGGVLFLDEVGSMPLEFQGKLLRILETRYFQRLGGSENIYSDFQLICATNDDLKEKIKKKEFREDFYHRINQVEIRVPPLRERKEDIPMLVDLFIRRFKTGAGASYQADSITPMAMEAMVEYDWPGNVRELKNVVERAIILSRKAMIDMDVLPGEISGRRQKPFQPSNEDAFLSLDPDPLLWPVQRLKAELMLALEVKRKILEYKNGNQWKAEFMRKLYPNVKAANAKGFDDMVKRISAGAWSVNDFKYQGELGRLLDDLRA